ncbi:MAG: DUF2164 domain-containing protein [Devosiaceae bacterium]|nr:DUF2164 domain-containing protein [Devosiaceae bacterium MH13]
MRAPTLSDARREALIEALQGYFHSEFDEQLSAFRAGELLDFMLTQLGPPLYNQGIADARAFLAAKLDDLDTDFPLLDV